MTLYPTTTALYYWLCENFPFCTQMPKKGVFYNHIWAFNGKYTTIIGWYSHSQAYAYALVKACGIEINMHIGTLGIKYMHVNIPLKMM